VKVSLSLILLRSRTFTHAELKFGFMKKNLYTENKIITYINNNYIGTIHPLPVKTYKHCFLKKLQLFSATLCFQKGGETAEPVPFII
jgi:hypothetical protein